MLHSNLLELDLDICMIIKFWSCYQSSYILVWTVKLVNLLLETHKEEGDRQLLCSSAAFLEATRRFFPKCLRHIQLQREKIITPNRQVLKISGACKYILCRVLFLSPSHICLHWVPSKLSSSKCGVEFFPQHFHTAAIPLNQPVREAFPHWLSKCRLPSPFSLNYAGLMPRTGNVQFWKNDKFFFTDENVSVFSIFFPNHTKLGTRFLCICRSCFCFPILTTPKGFLVIRFQSFIIFLKKTVNYFVSWFAFIQFNLFFILRRAVRERKQEWIRVELEENKNHLKQSFSKMAKKGKGNVAWKRAEA